MRKILATVVFTSLMIFGETFSQNGSIDSIPSAATLQQPKITKGVRSAESSEKKINAQFLIGNGFANEHGIGAGVRGMYLLQSNFLLGGTFVIHFGPTKNRIQSGNGNIYYGGGEIAGRISSPIFFLEPSIGLGQALIQNPDFAQSTTMQGKLYVAPGLTLTTRFETSNVGIHFRYLYIERAEFFTIYISYGT